MEKLLPFITANASPPSPEKSRSVSNVYSDSLLCQILNTDRVRRSDTEDRGVIRVDQ